MPRPSKHVSPDTLGGRIRAAREYLQLSLADVAGDHYSTSLISQIERNRIEPSEESLRYLATRLKLSFDDLEILAQQHRSANPESLPHKCYEDLRLQAAQFLAEKNTTTALDLLQDLYLPQIPASQRWRIAALRGQCYFKQRKFLKAQQDFMYAVSEQPKAEGLPADQRHEFMLLHLHLAGTHRELQQLDDALDQYTTTLNMMNGDTPFGYGAEAHWGMALIAYAQAHKIAEASSPISSIETHKNSKLHIALEHAENARFLYRAMGEPLRVAAVTCHIAQIEMALGDIERVRTYLKDVLNSWSRVLDEPPAIIAQDKHRQQEEASVVSAASCSLAGIELEAGNYQLACMYADKALAAGKRSYKLKRANAYLMRGRILEAMNPYDQAVEVAFRSATEELAGTHRIAARIGAHVRLGRHLLRIGKIEEGERELEQAHLLSDLVSASGPASSGEDIP
jgi:transcriptional regulator with XRE-family HTH domain